MQGPSFSLRGVSVATLGSDGNVPYGLIAEGAVVVGDGEILWVGEEADLPSAYASWTTEGGCGRLVTPALVDSHTHVVFGGNRAAEFEARLNGTMYEEAAQAGGGILATVRATRGASVEELVKTALPRVDALIAEGVATLEVKSGYGLDRDTELRMLRVARKITERRAVCVRTTYLGAHATPAEYDGRADAYIDQVCIPTLRAAHAEQLVDAVDGFCEGIAFQPEHIARVFDVAQQLGLPVKLHAEQFSNLGGAKLAARYGALSADHLEYLDEDGVRAMADAGTIAVLLPGAFYALGQTQKPPIDLLRRHGIPMALATDCNPGSSPLTSLLIAMNMGCVLLGLTPEEALAGVTREAARALGLADVGVIAPGMRADLAIWNVGDPAELSYRIGFNPLHKRLFGGAQ